MAGNVPVPKKMIVDFKMVASYQKVCTVFFLFSKRSYFSIFVPIDLHIFTFLNARIYIFVHLLENPEERVAIFASRQEFGHKWTLDKKKGLIICVSRFYTYFSTILEF